LLFSVLPLKSLYLQSSVDSALSKYTTLNTMEPTSKLPKCYLLHLTSPAHYLTSIFQCSSILKKSFNDIFRLLIIYKSILMNINLKVIHNLHIYSLRCFLPSKFRTINFLMMCYLCFLFFYACQIIILFLILIFTAWKVRCLIDLINLCSLCKVLFSRRYFNYPSMIPLVDFFIILLMISIFYNFLMCSYL
jgi:hypothetical protein